MLRCSIQPRSGHGFPANSKSSATNSATGSVKLCHLILLPHRGADQQQRQREVFAVMHDARAHHRGSAPKNARSFATARPRCEIRCFSCAGSSAIVRPSPVMMNSGS
jgi:hypothetical protein